MEVLLLTDVAGGYFCNNTALGREVEEGLPDLQKAFLSSSLLWGEVLGGDSFSTERTGSVCGSCGPSWVQGEGHPQDPVLKK